MWSAAGRAVAGYVHWLLNSEYFPNLRGELAEAFGIARRNLRADHLRGALSSWGITVGVAATIVTVGLSGGLKASIYERLGHLATQVNVTPLSGAAGPGAGSAKNLTDSDVAALRNKSVAPDISMVTPVVTADGVVLRRGSLFYSGSVIGSTTDYMDAANRQLIAGSSFTAEQERAGARLVVLGTGPARALFGANARQILGQSVRIGRASFTVIGLLKQDDSHDNIALVPLRAARVSLVGSSGALGTIILTATTLAAEGSAVVESNAVLNASHHIHDINRTDFKVTAQGPLLDSITRFNGNFEIFILAMTTILLLLGGVGIANVMVVSVTERTQEIGIRRAVGAKRTEIAQQFVIESGALAALGALSGIIVGLVLILVAGILFSLVSPKLGVPQVPWTAMVVSCVASVTIGTIAGLYPARRAARIQPIDALRYE